MAWIQPVFFRDLGDRLPPDVAREMGGESSADGTFVLRGIPTRGVVSAAVSASGFGSLQAGWRIERPETIQLAPAGSMRGSFTGASDPKTLAGVKVQIAGDVEGRSPRWCNDPDCGSIP